MVRVFHPLWTVCIAVARLSQEWLSQEPTALLFPSLGVSRLLLLLSEVDRSWAEQAFH